MDRLSRLFVLRLKHLARRDRIRQATASGLLVETLVDVDGHLVRRFAAAFDLHALSGDPERDGVLLKRWEQHRAVLAGLTVQAVPPSVGLSDSVQAVGRSGSAEPAPETSPLGGQAAYAVRLVGSTAEPPPVTHMLLALLLARAIGTAGLSLRHVVDIVRRPAPMVMLEAPTVGFLTAMADFLELSALTPTGPFASASGPIYRGRPDEDFASDEQRRRIVRFLGHEYHGQGLHNSSGLAAAFAARLPVVIVVEEGADVPAPLRDDLDLDLRLGAVDADLVASLLDAIYGDEAGDPDDGTASYDDLRLLTVDDVVLALRPGRSRATAWTALKQRAALNRPEDDDVADDTASEPERDRNRKPQRPEKPLQRKARPQKQPDKTHGRLTGLGIELVQPQDVGETTDTKPALAIETMPGLGAAREWALDLKVDLDDYRAGSLDWSAMSTKLLLSGPPGTGKTTFARALCNTTQIPLLATSVSTWLQGRHLNHVIDRMHQTFTEARSHAPAILFIDEIDGIGKRHDAAMEHADYWNTIVNKMLELLDGVSRSDGVIVIGATNRPEQIDAAITRSGRLETHIHIAMPDIPTLAAILAHHLGEDLQRLEREYLDTKLDKEQPTASGDGDNGTHGTTGINAQRRSGTGDWT